jgi:hypothetical protein
VLDVPAARVDPPLPGELLVPPFPEGPALLELEQAIAQGKSNAVSEQARWVRERSGCMMVFFSGSANPGRKAMTPTSDEGGT